MGRTAKLGGIAALACAATCGAGAVAASAATGPVAGLDPAALEVMNQPAYARGEWFISVRDLATGEQLVSHNAERLVEPGSVTKTYSIGAGWQHFGPEYRVTTPIKRKGKVVRGTLRGDLVLVAKGDMTMDGRTKANGDVAFTNLDHNDANALPGATLTPQNPLTGINKLAQRVRKSGIRAVSGNVIVDDRLFDTFELGDGPVTPIIVNNNLIDLTTTPTRPGRIARVAMRPRVAPWQVTTRVRTVAAGGATQITVSSPRHGRIVLSGTVAAGSDPALNVYEFDDPARFARTAFIQALRRAGVKVSSNAVATNPVGALPSKRAVNALPTVASLRSLPLKQEATYVLKVSYNRGAQTMVCLLAVAAGSTDCDDGLTKARQIWRAAGLNTDGAVIIDGSGLPGNLVTTNNQVDLQTIMARRPDAALWRSALPVLGVDGSLALVQRDGPAAGKVFAKTGTLGAPDLFNGRILFPAKALGGYMDANSGRRLVFAIVAANSVFSDIRGAFAANEDVGKVAAIIQQTH